MRHGSLFSGMGGFDLAAEWAGWENMFHCEWNEFGQRLLKYYWPNATSYGDITKTDFTIWRGRIDVLTGGFPCQPYSLSGERLGNEDDRHLWPEMLRAISEIQPSWIMAENVLGLVNWNDGLVFHELQTDLEAQGYEVQPFVLPACAVNAPHRRDRVWFVAYSPERRLERRYESTEEGQRKTTNRSVSTLVENRDWTAYAKSILCDRNHGLPEELDGITVSAWAVESIKAGGNAVVPQIPYQIFKAINQYELDNA